MIKTLLILAVVSYGALAAYAWLTADRQIFFPPPPSYTLSSIGAKRIPTGDGGGIAVVHLPNQEADLTILFSHGNAEDLGHALPFMESLRRSGFSVVGYDYRGYGASGGGPPTVGKTYEDIAAAYRYAVESLRIPPSRIIVLGRSVGSGPSTHLAATSAVGGLVVESGFTSAFVVLTRVPLLPFDRYPNLANIRRVECPVLIIHGTHDEIISIAHGRSLYAAAPEPKRYLWVEGAHHNDLALVAGGAYGAALRELGALVLASASDAGPGAGTAGGMSSGRRPRRLAILRRSW